MEDSSRGGFKRYGDWLKAYVPGPSCPERMEVSRNKHREGPHMGVKAGDPIESNASWTLENSDRTSNKTMGCQDGVKEIGTGGTVIVKATEVISERHAIVETGAKRRTNFKFEG